MAPRSWGTSRTISDAVGRWCLGGGIDAPSDAGAPPETFPRYLLGFLLGFGSGAAMIPYSIVKEVNPDRAKGSATGAMNFLVFVMTALAGPAIGWLMQKLAGGAALTLNVFNEAGSVYVAAIVLAAILTLFLKETGSAVRNAH